VSKADQESLDAQPASSLHSPSGQIVRIMLVDDHQVIIDGVEAMLRHEDRVQVVARALDRGGALAGLKSSRPDLVLLDVRVGRDSGLDICKDLLDEEPGVKIVFFTVYEDEQYIFQALKIGARGYILKQARANELVNYLQRVVDGEIVVDPSLAGKLAMTLARSSGKDPWAGAHLGLTQRESEVLGLLVRGYTNRAIGAALVIGEETVKTHLASIYRKLHAKDRAHAVAIALREGLFK